MLDIATLPNFCAHEHWGSINSIGMTPEGFRPDTQAGATPSRPTRLIDLIIEPYFGGCLGCAAQDLNQLAIAAGYEGWTQAQEDAPDRVLAALKPALRVHQLVGMWQTTRRGVLDLYGVDINTADAAALAGLDAAVTRNYADIWGTWYPEAMRRAHFSELIRPVHPIYHVRSESEESARKEAAVGRTILRIDPLLETHIPGNAHRAALAEMTGIEPGDATSWRACIARVMEIAEAAGTTGIKQLQAYSRSLDFPPVEDGDVGFGDDLTPDEVTVQQNWIINECFRHADERGWPHQIHTGTHNITESSPMPLLGVAQRYPRMKLVLIHTWPFFVESGWLAKQQHNVYIDTCWLPVLNPEFLREALAMWLNYVPTHKIMLSHDSTTVEMAVGSSLFTREILGEQLIARSLEMGIDVVELRRIAADMLHNNAVDVYGVGARAEM